MPIHIFCSRTKFRDYVAEYQVFLGEKGKKNLLSPSPLGRPDTQANVSEEDFLCKISDESLEIFSRPQIVANSRQYLLL